MANTWIFQCTKDRFDLSKPESLTPGKAVDWRVPRYRDQMKPDDVVYFWMAGDEKIRGLYGRGLIASGPYYHKEKDTWRIDAQVTEKFDFPVLASTLASDYPRLTKSLIFTQPQGSNFPLSPEEAEAIERAVASSYSNEKRTSEPTPHEEVRPEECSEQVRAIINRAEEIRVGRGTKWIHTADMLLALAEQPNGQFSALLAEARASLESIIAEPTDVPIAAK